MPSGPTGRRQLAGSMGRGLGSSGTTVQVATRRTRDCADYCTPAVRWLKPTTQPDRLLAMDRVEFCADRPAAYGPSSGAPVVSVPRRCLTRPATASPTRTTVTPASTAAGERPPPRPAARTSGTPIPGQGRPLRSDPSTPLWIRRQGAQGEHHPAAQQPASAGGEGRLTAFQDRAFQTNPGRGQPQGERPVPIGVDIVQQGAAVAGTLDQGTGRCCPQPGRNRSTTG